VKSIVNLQAKPSWMRLDQDLRSTLRDCGGFRGQGGWRIGRRGKEGRRRGERGEGEGGGKEEDPFCYDVVDVGSIEEVLEVVYGGDDMVG